MSAINSTVGLIYSIKATDSDARKTVSEFSKHVEKESDKVADSSSGAFAQLGKSIGLTETQIGALGKSLPVVGAVAAGIGAIATAGITTAKVLFDLTKQTAEAGAEIDRYQKLTGLTVETIGSIKNAAEQGGSSLSEVSEAWESFVEVLTEGARGSDEAREKLIRLGLDPQKAFKDVEGSFARVVKVIGDIEDPIKKAAAASDAMGESSLPLLPMFAEMGNNLGDYTKRLKDYGVVMDADGVRQSKEFDSTLKLLNTQIKGIITTFAREFMPQFTAGMKDLSGWVKDNKATFAQWGKEVSGWLRLVRDGVQWFNTPDGAASLAALQAIFTTAQGKPVVITPGAIIPKENKQKTSFADFRKSEDTNTLDNSVFNTDTYKFGENKELLEKQNAAAEKAAEKAKQAREKQLKLQIEGLDLDAQLAEQAYEAFKKNLDDLLKAQSITFEDYQKQLDAQIDGYIAKVVQIQREKRAVLAKLFSGKELENENKKVDQERQSVLDATGSDALKANLDTFQREIKAKETAIKDLLELEKAKAQGELAENERLYNSKERLESAYVKFRENVALNLLEKEKKYTGEAIDEIRKIIEKRAADQGVSAEGLLKENDVYNQLLQRHAQLLSLISAQGKVAQAELARIRTQILDDLEADEKETEETRLALFRETERKKYQALIQSGKNRKENLRGLLEFETDILQRELEAEQKKQDKEKETYLESIKGLENAEQLKLQIEELYKQKRLLSEEEFQRRKKEIEAEFNPQIYGATIEDTGGGILGGFAKQLGLQIDSMYDANGELKSQADFMKGIYEDLATVAGGALGSMVQGIAQLGTQWILTGQLSGKAILQMTASIIAGIASQSAIKAIFELAEGFAAAASFPWNPDGLRQAAMHFAAAKTYGVVAGVAAVAAVGLRVGIGDSFKKETSSGTASSAVGDSSSGGSSRGSSDGFGRYSSFGDNTKVIEESRNEPQKLELIVRLRPENGFIRDAVVEDIRNNGMIRNMIIDIAEA